jgi:plasmid stabilization system protein ParE
VAQVIYTDGAADDIERIFEFLAERDPYAAGAAVAAIRDAIEILSRHPLIGRDAHHPLRELVISFGQSGYVALYRYLPEHGLVRIVGIRHQRELDFPV